MGIGNLIWIIMYLVKINRKNENEPHFVRFESFSFLSFEFCNKNDRNEREIANGQRKISAVSSFPSLP